MPTISQQAIDVKWMVTLVSSATVYTGLASAITAATTLSAGNSNAPVQIARIEQTVTQTALPILANVKMPGAGTPLYQVQLATGTVYYPLETARVQAYTTSTSNSNAPVYVARVLPWVVTAP